jgi:hypothetical protein
MSLIRNHVVNRNGTSSQVSVDKVRSSSLSKHKTNSSVNVVNDYLGTLNSDETRRTYDFKLRSFFKYCLTTMISFCYLKESPRVGSVSLFAT